jgi:hypothetical protein
MADEFSFITEDLAKRLGRHGGLGARYWSTASNGRYTGLTILGLLFLHASAFQYIGPFPAGPSVAVLQVLPEVVGAVELLRIVALAELVHARQVLEPPIPVYLGVIWEVFAAVPAHIVRRTGASLVRWRHGSGERGLKTDECGTRPRIQG